MRVVASALLLGFALAAGAAEIWRWTDADGVVHFSDNPVPGAVRVDIGPAPKPSGSGPVPDVPSIGSRVTERVLPPVFRYTRCGVQSPAADETFHGVQPVNIVLQVEPALQSGHRIEVRVDGALVRDWPPESLSFTLPEVVRGSHTVQMRVLDAGGVILCTAEPRTFHLRQTSVLPPAGRGR
jgi:hypothetical protein